MQNLYTLSNFLSLFRLLIAIPLWFLFDDLTDLNTRYVVLTIALIGIVTDYLDGYFARKYNEVSEVGKIIDPLADKVLVGVVVVKLFLINEIPGYLFLLIIGRDLLIFFGGLILSAKIKRVLPSNYIGKVTVTILSLLLILVILQVDENTLYFQLIYYSTIALIVISFVIYLIRALEFLNKEKHGTI